MHHHQLLRFVSMKKDAATFQRSYFLLLFVAALSAADEQDVVAVSGTTGGTIVIPCFEGDGEPAALPTSVQWLDRVYANTADPILIFDSAGNPDRSASAAHPNHANYRIDAAFRLHIDALDIETDVGEYICRAQLETGEELERRYGLSIADEPRCEGPDDTRVMPGTEVTLTCEMLFSSYGANPTMQWRADAQPVASRDLFDVGVAKRKLTLEVKVEDDRKPYRCVTSLGDAGGECSITLSVPHSVRDVKFAQHAKTVFQVGEELRCEARGNPAPQITLAPSVDGGKETSGSGWKSIRIPADWQATNQTIRCTAVNDVDGERTEATAEISFNVTAAKPIMNTGGNGAASMIKSELYGSVIVFFASLLTALALLR